MSIISVINFLLVLIKLNNHKIHLKVYFCLQTNNKVNIFALEIWDDEAAKCTFYTVKYDEAETNETDLFFEKYE